jgi:hypothetical protein
MEDADDEDIIPVKEYEIKMEDTEDEVIIPHHSVSGRPSCDRAADGRFEES